MIVNQDKSLNLLDKYFETAFSAPDGIQRLRELILTLAMQGKLVPQDPSDQPASELLRAIEAEKKRLIKEKKIKKSETLPEITLDEIPYEIPDSWVWVRLGNLTIFNSGKTPASKNPIYWSDTNGFHWSSIADLPSRGYLHSTKKKITQQAIDDVFKSEPLPVGTLLMSFKLSIGKIAITNIPTYHNEAIISFNNLIPNLKMYLFWILDVVANTGDKKNAIKGNTLNSTSLNNLLIPLPPLNEQYRIVEKIDRLMAQCDRLEKLRTEKEQKRLIINIAGCDRLLKSENEKEFNQAWDFINNNFGELYAVKENVRELRKAILQLAVMGKLVPQDPSDRPASELLKEIEAEKKRLIKEGKIKESNPLPEITPDEIPYEIPKSWAWVRLGNLIDLISGQHLTSTEYNTIGEGCPYYTGPSDFGIINPITTRWTTIEKAVAIQGDILLGVKGSVGKTNILMVKKAVIGRQLMALRSIKIDKNFLMFFLDVKFEEFKNLSVGIAIPGISRPDVLTRVFPLPPLEEQHHIVTKVDQLMKLCDKLEEKIEQSTDKKTTLLNAVMANI